MGESMKNKWLYEVKRLCDVSIDGLGSHYLLGTQSLEPPVKSCAPFCSAEEHVKPRAGLLNWAAVGVAHDVRPLLVRYGEYPAELYPQCELALPSPN